MKTPFIFPLITLPLFLMHMGSNACAETRSMESASGIILLDSPQAEPSPAPVVCPCAPVQGSLPGIPQITQDAKAKAKAEAKERDPLSRSWVPIAGYNPTYRFFAGGGFFLDLRDHYSFGFAGIITQDLVAKGDFHWGQSISSKIKYSLDTDIARGFEPIYGEGGQTQVSDRVDVNMSRLTSALVVGYEIMPGFTAGPVFDLRVRRNPPVPANSPIQLSRREDRLAFGLFEQMDYRNQEGSPTFGWFENITAMVAPDLSGNKTAPFFGLLDGNLRLYQEVLEGIVIAYQVAAGFETGTPSYLFEYRLGGTHRLRGYLDNRFRGTKYYLQQTEVRFPIFKAVSGVAFLEFGEITNGNFVGPATTQGFGLRVGLPPDYLAQVRLDVAFGKDQSGIFVDFGHAF